MDSLSSTVEASLAAEPARLGGNTGDVEYRAFREESDLPIIMDLVDVELSEPYSIFTYRYFINQWPDLCYLAFVGTKCIGTIVCKMDEHKNGYLRGYIAMLVVLKQFRGRKVATELVNCCMSVMLQAGCLEVILEAEVTNAGALALYGNLGFIRAKRLHRYYLNGADAYRLKLLFPQPDDDQEDVHLLPPMDPTHIHDPHPHHPDSRHEIEASAHHHVHGEHCNHSHHPPPNKETLESTNGHLAESHTVNRNTHGRGTQVPAHVHSPSCKHGHGERSHQPPVHIHGPSCRHGHGGGGGHPRQEPGHVHGPSCRHGNSNGNASASSQNEGREGSGHVHVHGPACRHGQGEGGSIESQGEAKGGSNERSGKKKGQKKKGGNKHKG